MPKQNKKNRQPRMSSPSNYIICVFGRKGSGKTYLVKNQIIDQFDRVVILDSMNEYSYMIKNSIIEFYDALKANRDRNIFRITYRPADRRAEEFFKVVKYVPNLTIVVEEASKYTSAYKMIEDFEDIIQYGRHHNQNLVAISRRPSEISRNISAQADIVIAFQTTEPRDVDYFKKFIENPEELKQLKTGDFKIVLGEQDAKKAIPGIYETKKAR